MELDLRGEECPLPTIKAVEAMKRLRGSGERQVVIVDDPTCAADIPHQAGRTGFRAASQVTGDSERTISLEPVG